LTQIAFLLYPDLTALDEVRPYEVLARLPGADVKFVATTPGPLDDTAAGVSAGIDMALQSAASEAGETTHGHCGARSDHDPDPPFDSGSIEKADEQTRRRATGMMVPGAEEAQATA
jgi:hypothetical protein